MIDTYVRGKEEKIVDTMNIQSVKLTWQVCIQNLKPVPTPSPGEQ